MKKLSCLIAGRVAVSLAAVLMLGACAATTPVFDANFSHATRQTLAAQVRDSEATTRNQDRPVDGLDGRAAREAMDRYYQSFSQPPTPTNVFSIGLSTGAGEAGGNK